MPRSFVCRRRPTVRCHANRVIAFFVIMVSSLAGCRTDTEIDTTYGQRRGQGIRGVGGTAVLGSLFEQAGYRVSSWRRLSPKLQKEDVIVWVPDRFRVPYPQEIEFLEAWLRDEPERTLIYLGRDYDAVQDYWQRVLQQSNPRARFRTRQELARARSEHLSRRSAESDDAECRWFAFDFDVPAQRIDALDGSMAESLRSQPVDLTSTSQLKLGSEPNETEWYVAPTAQPILTGRGRILAAQLSHVTWNGSQVIVVADGSWLLNLPQVDDTNRRLADELIKMCGTPGRVCFLEAGVRPLAVNESDSELPLILRLFSVWPMNLFMLHLVVVGILYCVHLWPIFGRPRSLDEDSVSDFGKHVAAVGEMLERGRDDAYARSQIRQYLELTAGKSAEEITD